MPAQDARTMGGISPRWLVNFLSWTPVEAGIFRLNQVNAQLGDPTDVECSPSWNRNPDLPETFVDYESNRREYFLKAVTTVLDVQTRVSDLYSQISGAIMNTSDPADSLPSAAPESGGQFARGTGLLDVGILEQMANAFFKGMSGGAPPSVPAVPSSAPAPWSPPAPPAAAQTGSAIPFQPPFGNPDVSPTSAPASSPARSLSGASAGSASPLSFNRSRIRYRSAGAYAGFGPRCPARFNGATDTIAGCCG